MGMERPSPHAFQVSADRSRLRIAINSAGRGILPKPYWPRYPLGGECYKNLALQQCPVDRS